MLLHGQPPATSQHRRDVIVVSVRFVVRVAVVEVDVGVTRRRGRGGPDVVGPAARIAFALCVAMLPEGELQPCRNEAALRDTSSRSSSPRGPDDAALGGDPPEARRGKRQRHPLQAPFGIGRNRCPHEAPANSRRNALP